MQETSSTKPPRTPWIERTVFLIVIAALGSWLAYTNLIGTPHTIVIDGKPSVTLETRPEARSVLEEVRSRQLGDRELESPAFAQRVSIRRASPGAAINVRQEAVSTLDQALVLKARGFAILVDDQVTIALGKEKEAAAALNLVKQRYAQRLKSLYSRPGFKEKVAIDARYLPVEKILAGPESAADYLTAVHEKPTYHTLKPGDRAVRLTAQYGISLDELKALNPGINMDRLVEGDRLMVRKPKQPITVVTKALVTKVTPVKAPAERGVPARTGKRQTWAVVTYENGREVSQDAIRVMTTWDKPAPRQSYSSSGRRSFTTKRAPSKSNTRKAAPEPSPKPTTSVQPAQSTQPAQPTTP